MATALIENSVGDLATLNHISEQSKAKYYVRIAAGKSVKDLDRYLHNLDDTFPGSIKSGTARIRQIGPKKYFLVFGQHVGLFAADVLQWVSYYSLTN